jgi:hypothetical protein
MVGIPTAVRVFRGIDVFVDFALPNAFLFLAATIAVLAVRSRLMRILATLVLVQCAYAIWIGGDAWEWSSVGANRFTCVAIPFVFAIIHLGSQRIAVSSQWKKAAVCTVSALAMMFVSNGFLDTNWRARFDNVTLRAAPLYVPEHERVVREVLALDEEVLPTAKVAVVWAGISGFFSRYRLIDVLGYNDRVIAHGPVADFNVESPDSFTPGHMKYDYDYTLDILRPDVVHRTAHLDPDQERELLTRKGFVRRGSYWFRENTEQQVRRQKPAR